MEKATKSGKAPLKDQGENAKVEKHLDPREETSRVESPPVPESKGAEPEKEAEGPRPGVKSGTLNVEEGSGKETLEAKEAEITEAQRPTEPSVSADLVVEQGPLPAHDKLVTVIAGGQPVSKPVVAAVPWESIEDLWRLFVTHVMSIGFGSYLREAVLTLLVMLSAFLGQPLMLLIRSDSSRLAIRFQDAIARCVPEGFLVKADELDMKVLGGSFLKGKTIVSANEAAFRKIQVPIALLLSRGEWSRPRFVPGQGFEMMESLKAEGPVSLVSTTEGPAISDFWGRPGVLTITLASADFTPENMAKRTVAQPQGIPLDQVLRVELGRLVRFDVVMTFSRDIINSLAARKDPYAEERLEVIERLIGITTVVDHLQASTPEERNRSFYGLSSPAKEEAILTATKIDYWRLWLLRGILFADHADVMAERQKRTLQAIKNLCMDWVNSTFSKGGSNKDILNTLYHKDNIRFWPTVEDIAKSVNNDGGPKFSTSAIRKEIEDLVKRKYVTRERNPLVANGFVYAPANLDEDEGSALTLPEPSSITDPVFEGTTVEVVNPYSGEPETI